MATRYDPLSGRLHEADRVSANSTQFYGKLKAQPKIILPGGAVASSVPATGHLHSSHGGGLVAGWVNRPNNIPQHQAFFQKNAGAISIHHMGPKDAMINRLIFGFTVVGLGCVLFSLGSMALGVNKKKKA